MLKFCWNCGKKMTTNTQGHTLFKIYTDPIGNEHMVHLSCAKTLARKPVTAQIKETDITSTQNLGSIDGDEYE